ncbi:inositol phosphokinase [Fragilaria crotonensis]|nr:inositol phosphokinase [Fragilaria crotonensis]
MLYSLNAPSDRLVPSANSWLAAWGNNKKLMTDKQTSTDAPATSDMSVECRVATGDSKIQHTGYQSCPHDALTTHSNMTPKLYILLASSTAASLLTLYLLRRRARKRAKRVADRAIGHVVDGPLIDTEDPALRERILQSAKRRASKWMTFQLKEPPTAMPGQVGGRGDDKAPILSLGPEYVLKPVNAKEYRGLREVAFYESVELASYHNKAIQTEMLPENPDSKEATSSSRFLEYFDVLAMTLAILLGDPVVAASETTLLSSWATIKREIEVLRRLSLFTASYYGVVENIQPQVGVGGEGQRYHILLQDVTSSFRRPCVMDIKIGTQTFEPDSSLEKQDKERRKYGEHQIAFGFRLVGMRKYDPTHPAADQYGYLIWDKHYGRSLTSMESLIDAFTTFFRASSNGQNDILGSGKIRRKAVASVLGLVRSLRHRFEDNQCLAFYSSSLLIVYDAEDNSDYANLRMVDFGHVRRQAGGDPGYQHGLRTLSSILVELLEEEPTSRGSSPVAERERLMTV